MKNTKKLFTSRLVCAAMAMLLLFAAFASLGAVKAQAAIGYIPAPEGDGITDVYYLFDYYPEIGNTEMANDYPDVDIVYDRTTSNIEATLMDIAVGAYAPINALPNNATVVIDIKTFKPEAVLLEYVFSYIKTNLECKTFFVSVYDDEEFNDATANGTLFAYLDEFHKTQHKRLRYFCEHSTRHDVDENGTLDGTCILIDGNVVDVNSPFSDFSLLKKLLVELWSATAAGCLQHTHSDYRLMIEHLKNEHNISLLVHTGGNTFKDMATHTTYTASGSNTFGGLSTGWSYIYAIGFYHLDPSFHNYLEANQLNGNDITVYLLEADPFERSEDGLDIISDYDLKQMYGYDADNVFIDKLIDLINS